AVGGLLLTEVGSHALLSFSPYTEQIEGARKSGASFTEVYAKMGVPASAIKKWTDVAVFCTPGFLVIDITLFLLLSLLLFGRLRGWRAAVEGTDVSLATPYLFRNLAFPDWLLFAFVIGGVSPLMKGVVQHVGANILAVVIFLYLVQERKKWTLLAQQEKDVAAKAAEAVKGTKITIEKRTGEQGQLFGSVTSNDIADALEAKGHKVDKRRIELAHPIKTLGTHDVE